MADGEMKKVTFTGTPLECEAWLRRFFDVIRVFLGNEDESNLELFEKTAWEIDLSAIDGMLKDRVRKDLRSYGDLITIERELFDLVANSTEGGINVDSDTMLTDQKTVDLED